jgi:hypothetical protein
MFRANVNSLLLLALALACLSSPLAAQVQSFSPLLPSTIPTGLDALEPSVLAESYVEGQLPETSASQPFASNALPVCPQEDFTYYLSGKGRGYYINDQRIEFTGLEETFLVEGVLAGGIQQQSGSWLLSCDGEFFVNQPFERNIYQDSPIRQSFAHNFDPNPFQISQLNLSAQNGNWKGTLGRFATPFGRYYYPIYRNSFDDSPFIRSEAIIYRETGLMLEWTPSNWSFAAALTNGGFEGDTNSSKALVARAGYEGECFACGVSIKEQDGTGSENQKNYKTHYGVDALVRAGCWSLSTEAIYDVYGLRRPFPQDDIFWGRSLYWRDVNKGPWQPIHGFGYYVNLQYQSPRWTMLANYGEFYPEQLGIAKHDQTNRRGLVKASRHWTPLFETYAVVMLETDLPQAFAPVKDRNGVYYILGCQFSL